jgi:hypothetical protein
MSIRGQGTDVWRRHGHAIVAHGAEEVVGAVDTAGGGGNASRSQTLGPGQIRDGTVCPSPDEREAYLRRPLTFPVPRIIVLRAPRNDQIADRWACDHP